MSFSWFSVHSEDLGQTQWGDRCVLREHAGRALNLRVWVGSEQKISTGAGLYVVRTKEHFTEISSCAVQYIADRFLHGLKFLSVYFYYILVATYMPKMERLKSNFENVATYCTKCLGRI